MHTIAELLAGHPGLVTDRAAAGQIAHILHNTAIELDAGRRVPNEVRRAVRALADALRVALDPRGRT
nr:hypothetical protein [Pseudonocardia acidicola]